MLTIRLRQAECPSVKWFWQFAENMATLMRSSFKRNYLPDKSGKFISLSFAYTQDNKTIEQVTQGEVGRYTATLPLGNK